MGRFLIRPDVLSCKNLASCVLGMAVREFPRDFEARYGHHPLLLESFVDTSHYTGTCYRAANWQYIGRNKGVADRTFSGRERKHKGYLCVSS